jgi:hypothetical protein
VYLGLARSEILSAVAAASLQSVILQGVRDNLWAANGDVHASQTEDVVRHRTPWSRSGMLDRRCR